VGSKQTENTDRKRREPDASRQANRSKPEVGSPWTERIIRENHGEGGKGHLISDKRGETKKERVKRRSQEITKGTLSPHLVGEERKELRTKKGRNGDRAEGKQGEG